MLTTRIFSSLEKYIPGADIMAYPECSQIVAAKKEIVAFQFAVRNDNDFGTAQLFADCRTLPVTLRSVELIPSYYPGPRTGGDVLSEESGLYSDLLKPMDKDNIFHISKGAWKVFYIQCSVPADAKCGKHTITLTLKPYARPFARWSDSPVDQERKYSLDVVVDPITLPEMEMERFEWFHCDSLTAYYKIAPWSEEHWRIVENFAANAVRHDVTVLFTPLWTPPLNTGIGLTRPDCQLLKINYDHNSGKYIFDFTRLRRYLAMGNKLGFRAFSMSHIFSQWGAKAAPAIYVTDMQTGSRIRKFGWDTPADGAEYQGFLSQLMPELLPVLRESGKKCYFSLSDEPTVENDFEHYAKLVKFVRPLLEEFETVEAMSHLEFYNAGLVRHPVAELNKLDEFKGIVPDLATYYCVGHPEYTNRFFKMPLRRTRLFGTLCFIYDLKFFLHWGYNFYFNQYSDRMIDPFRESDAGGVYPSGDAFLVYPGDDGDAWDSLRGEAFYDGLQDLRMLRLLESRIGRTEVLELIRDIAGFDLSAKVFPTSDHFIIAMRQKIREILLDK